MGLQQDLGLKVPLIVAPMAGGPTTPALAAASCEAGALGSLGLAYSAPDVIAEQAAKMRALTSRLYGMNLFVPALPPPSLNSDLKSRGIEVTAPFRDEMKLAPPRLEAPFEEDFDLQFEEVLRARPGLFSFVFGRLASHYIREAQAAGQTVVGTATTLEEALALEDDGVDAVVLQGFEAGGHRGIHDAMAPDPEIGTFELLRQGKGRLKKPVIAAGGLMNARDIREAFSLGAELVQLGSAFLLTKEAGTSEPYRARLSESPRVTRTTRAFSGRLARGLENRFMRDLDQRPDAILPYPAQNKFTRDIRNAYVKAGSSDALSLWCGSGDGELSRASCAEVIASLFA